MGKTNSKKIKSRKILFAACIILWLVVIWAFFMFLRYKGGLKPEAALDDQILISSPIEVVGENDVPIKKGKVILEKDGINNYIYLDSNGVADISLMSGVYKIRIEASGYKVYESTLDLSSVRSHRITVFKE